MISLFSRPAEFRYQTAKKIGLISSRLFLILGVLLIAYAGYVIVDARIYENIEVTKLESSLPPVPDSNLHKPVERVAAGDVIGEIQVPRLGLKAVVAEGTSQRILRRAVGHIPYTAMPGETGNIGLAGHRDSFFRALSKIRVGDVISLRTTRKEFRYEVQATQIVSPDDTSVLSSSATTELTLVTCFPFDYIGPAPDRFVVRARAIN